MLFHIIHETCKAKSIHLSFNVIVFKFAINKVTSLLLGCTVVLPNSNTIIDLTLVFESNVVKCGSTNGHQTISELDGQHNLGRHV